MRIFLGLTEVSGFFSRLKEGFDELGVEAIHVSLQPHRFGYLPEGARPLVVRWAQAAVQARVDALRSGQRLVRLLSLPAVVLTRALLLAWALARFDAFILGAGSSFFSFREFPLFGLLGKKLIYTLHGTDARPAYVDGFFDPADYGMGRTDDSAAAETVSARAARLAAAHVSVTAMRVAQIARIERHADVVVCGTGYCSTLTRRFADLLAIGVPIMPCEPSPSGKSGQSPARTCILHAPSNPAGKGTRFIREVIASLQERGIDVDYTEVSGVPNAEILQRISDSDIVIDQFFSDTPMASFAAEASALGKPAVVGGYYSAEIARHTIPEHLPPTLFCLPRNVVEEVASLVVDPSNRAQIGATARRYVVERWNPKTVASRFIRLLEGLPEEWAVDPLSVGYMGGIGVSDEQARANVAAVIERFGVAGLGLAHRPDLERAFVEFSKHRGDRC